MPTNNQLEKGLPESMPDRVGRPWSSCWILILSIACQTGRSEDSVQVPIELHSALSPSTGESANSPTCERDGELDWALPGLTQVREQAQAKVSLRAAQNDSNVSCSFFETTVAIRCPTPTGTFCRLYESPDLLRWAIGDTTVALDNWVTFEFPRDQQPQVFFRLEFVSIAPLPEMVWITPGEFLLSSPANEVGRFLDKEDPQTTVLLTRGYWISRYEVTQGQFKAVLNINPSLFAGDAQRPVEDVTWFEAVQFCQRLTEQERQAGHLPEGFEYRLPTEAEWAYACRAGTTTRFSYGDDPGYLELRNYSWYHANSGLRPHPVGQKLPNPWGLYDMHGNVFEWCSDWYGPLPGGYQIDPKGALSGTDRIIRGGYWDSGPDLCRSAVRVHFIPVTRISYLGFRIVLAEIRNPQG